MRRTQTVYESDSLSRRLGRLIALLAVIFTVTAAVVVTQRFQPETLALITGLLIAGIPLLALTGLLAYIVIKTLSRQHQPPQQMTIPPIVLQVPSQQPSLPYDNTTFPWNTPQRQLANREWDVLGEEEA